MQTDQQDRVRDNVRIATELGWVNANERRMDWQGQCFDGWFAPGHKASEDDVPQRLPDYFTDANAALSICEFMAEKRYFAFIENLTQGWECQFRSGISGANIFEAEGDTLAQAICRAFIAFLDARKEGL